MQIPSPSGIPDLERNRKIDQRGSAHAAGFAPVKAWMSDENQNTAHKQGQKTERCDPVGNTNDQRVTREIQAVRSTDLKVRKVRRIRHSKYERTIAYERAANNGDGQRGEIARNVDLLPGWP